MGRAASIGVKTSDDQFRSLLAAAPEGLIVFDDRDVVSACSAVCEHLFGYAAGELNGLGMQTLMVTAQERDGNWHTAGSVGDKPWRIGASREVGGKRKDGSTFPLCLSVGTSQRDGRKMFVGIFHSFADLKLDETVREHAAKLSSILETVPDAIIVIDGEGKVESFSKAASLLFGYLPADIIGKSVMALMPLPYTKTKGRSAAPQVPFDQGLAGGRRIVVGMRADGGTFPMEITLGGIKGPRRLFTCFVRDVSKRQGTQQRLEELQAELLHVSRLSAMGQMTAAIAHELNQPLTAITNYASAARRTLAKSTAHDEATVLAQSLVDKVNAQAFRAGAIVKNIRNFVEKGHGALTEESLSHIIAETLALAFVGAADENIGVTLRLDPALDHVIVNKIQIQQVFHNLIRNAVEAMLSAHARELTLSTQPGPAGRVEVIVQDTGTGLAPEIRARLFHPFTTTKTTGMGIGLTICQSIVEAHGSRISLVQSTPAGTEFRFSLPLVEHPGGH